MRKNGPIRIPGLRKISRVKTLGEGAARWNRTSAQRVSRDGDSFWIVAGDVMGLPREPRPSRIRNE
jgi:hypothetical protein